MITAALALLGGCSALRFGYNQADTLAFRWLDGYADFDAVQARRVRQALDAWFAWNRKTQLADYAGLLGRLDATVHADTTPERVCGWWAEAREQVDRGLEQALPAIAEVAVSLRPAQIENVERHYAKANREFRADFLQTDPLRRQREAAKRAISRAEWFYGDFDSAQQRRIEAAVATIAFDPALALDERQRRQQDALQVLRRLGSGAVGNQIAQADVRAYVQRAERSPREAYRRHAEQLALDNCRLAAEIHNGTTPAQRSLASKRLKGWAADLRALATEPG